MAHPHSRRTLLKGSLLGVAGAAGLPAAGSAAGFAAATPGGWAREIDEIIAPITTERGLGVMVRVRAGGRTVFAKGYGRRDHGLPERFTGTDFFEVEQLDDLLDLPRGRRRPTADTIFNIGSISKGFTTGAVLLLQERRKLSVHDRLGTFLPDYTTGADITLLQLMHQQSGIPDYNAFPRFQAAYDDFLASGETDLSAVVAKLETLPLQFPPGSEYAYSNSNYLLLGQVVERVAGLGLGRFLARNVFGPLGMRDTRHGYPAKGSTDVALGYRAKPARVARAYQWNLPWMSGAGSLTSTARDLGRWQDALWSPGLFRRSSLRTMFTGRLGGYGCGWVVTTHGGEPYLWHNGGMGGFRSMHALFPDQQISVTLLSNDETTTPALEQSAPLVFDVVRDAR